MHWGIIKNRDQFIIGDTKYGNKDDAIAYAQGKLNNYLQHIGKNGLKQILVFHGYSIQPNHFGHNKITSIDSISYNNIQNNQLIDFVKTNLGPMVIREFEDYLCLDPSSLFKAG
jgi:hypothetical protein